MPQHSAADSNSPDARDRLSTAPTISGRWLVLALLIVGLSAGGAAVWWRSTVIEKTTEFWGPVGSENIRYTPQAEAFLLSPTCQDLANVQCVLAQKDVTGAPGLVEMRRSLLSDFCYLWIEPPPKLTDAATAGPELWKYVLQFKGPKGTTTLLFAPLTGRIRFVEENREVRLTPDVAGLDGEFFRFHFPESKATAPAATAAP